MKGEVHIFNKQVEQTHLMLGGFGISRMDEDRFAAEVGNAILSRGFGSRLFQVIRDQLGLAYYVYSRVDMLEEIGSYQVGLGVDNRRAEAAIEAVIKELKALRDGGFTDDELEVLRKFCMRKYVKKSKVVGKTFYHDLNEKTRKLLLKGLKNL